ncbi:MAG: SIR2 family protein [Balneolales bacterium]
MNEQLILDYDAFLRSFKKNTDVSHSFLLGAGASISSGIQSAYDCIWEWKKDIYLSRNVNASDFFKNYKEVAVRKNIQKWLDNQGEYPALDSEKEYSFYAEKAYPIAEDRRKYFLGLIENKEPYVGYKLLCELAKGGIVKSIWTTNFDGLIVRAAHQNNLIPIEVNLDNVERQKRTESSKELLTIALHGDYKFSSLKNTVRELDSQEAVFKEHLANYHIDRNLVVIGYSGRDKSLMDALKYAFKKDGAGRLYWCGYGDTIPREVESLLNEVRLSGREAHFISTDGFDKTVIHLAKAAFEDNQDFGKKIQQALEVTDQDSFTKSDFTLNFRQRGKYIKSNLHPVVFPNEVFQFEIDYKGERPWAFLRSLTSEKDICAIPFKRKVYAIGTLTEISKVFKPYLKSKIKRTPIRKVDIERVSSFKALMLQAILKHFSYSPNLSSNFKNKIWVNNEKTEYKGISAYKALSVSLYFDKSNGYGYLTFTPTVYMESKGEIKKLERQQIGKQYLEKLFNNKYDELLESWNNRLFNATKIKFEYPFNSGSGFEFIISKSTAFGEIDVLDKNFRHYGPKNYNTRQTLFKGVQFLEPQLIFKNISSNQDFKHYHPMRGLIKNRPYDVNLSGSVLSSDVNLSVICGSNYSKQLFDFLSKLNSKHQSGGVNPNYLIDYTGFSNIYNIPINVPNYEDSEKWVNMEFRGENESDSHKNAVKLARLITSKIDQIANSHGQSTVVVFIPNEWHPFESFVNEEETFDLHDYIKAYAATQGITTQLIREKTLNDKLKCQIYWWLSLSFYVKALRTPWILNNQERDTAYAGIGYSVSKIKDQTEIVIGCSHIYDSNGQGLKYKLSKIDDFFLDHQNNPFLSYNEAFQFGVSIRELFYQSLDKLPERVVIHKRTKFTTDEINGIKASLHKAGIKKIDLIEIAYESDARFLAMNVYNRHLQVDKFPISRGTCLVTKKDTALLWTHGIVPSVRQPNYKFYLGGRSIPAPVKIVKHYGNSNIDIIATEILGLSKMNWNSFDLYSKLPSTIDSSNQIAKIGKLLSRFEGRTYDYRLFI